MNSPLHRVILDTDIGTDVDDLMALALLLAAPEVDVLAITTVYGDTRLRAQLAARVLSVAGRSIGVHAGEPQPLSGREVWWAGHEGALHTGLQQERYDSDDAIGFLSRAVTSAPGAIDLIAIGPLTNIARAIRADARFASAVRHLWIMGGAFTTDEAEHNILSDAAAAEVVLGAGIPTTVTALEVTRRIRIDEPDLAAIARSGRVGELIGAEIDQWWRFTQTAWNVPHDPVTVLTMTRPDLFEFSEPGTVAIGLGQQEGRSRFTPGAGTVRVVTDLDADAVATAIVAGIVAGGLGTPPPPR